MRSLLKGAGFALLAIGAASMAFGSTAVPEIDAATGTSAIALIGGALLIIRSRKR